VHPLRWLKVFYVKAYEDNLTGLSAMVAYNLMLSIFPFALLLLFIAGRVLRSPSVESSVLGDLGSVFPNTGTQTLEHALNRVRESSTSIGLIAIAAGVWVGTSFWGAMDTAFCRIYHVECRSWVKQKRFGLAMLAVIALFMAATVALPAAEALLLSGREDLPFGLSDIPELVTLGSILVAHTAVFVMLATIYVAVPKARVPWRAVWPGALGATLAIGFVNFAFPFYLQNISSLAHLGSTVGFVLIALLWFYALALIVLGGAIVNAMRFEMHDTGEVAAASRGVTLV
jgi:YihY family inner membrane protein